MPVPNWSSKDAVNDWLALMSIVADGGANDIEVGVCATVMLVDVDVVWLYASSTDNLTEYVPAPGNVAVLLVADELPFGENDTLPGPVADHVYVSGPVPDAEPLREAVLPAIGV